MKRRRIKSDAFVRAAKRLVKKNSLVAADFKNFRQFYLTFPDSEKSYAPRSQLTPFAWTHYRLIMRVESLTAREYYLQEAATQS